MEKLVIIGAGQSAIQCITSLKKEGYSGSITLVGEEEHLPYQRPPLSKGFLEDSINKERFRIKEQHDSIAFYRNFMDSILGVDQWHRKNLNAYMDSLSYIEPYPQEFIDSITPIIWRTITSADSSNAVALIAFTKKYGFPAGKNAAWDHAAPTFLLQPLTYYFAFGIRTRGGR